MLAWNTAMCSVVNSMKIIISFAVLFFPIYSAAECGKNPTNALEILKSAYKEKNKEKAVNAFDFGAWAEFHTQSTGVDIEADTLRKGFMNNLEKSGFPDYSNLTCEIKEKRSNNKVVVEDSCKFKDGSVSYKYSLIAVKIKCGWKLAGPNLPNKTR